MNIIARCGLVGGIALFAALESARAITIPVFCSSNPNAIGEITVNAQGSGIAGGFSSFVPQPGPPTLAGAAAACGEDHFNWYQIVTADNQPPPGIAPPYVDPPSGGYPLAFDPTWADTLPWYYDEWTPGALPPGRVFNPGLTLQSKTQTNLLQFGDFPNSPTPGLNLS
ncbi:MAG: hypothetical protein ACRD8O_11430, partial [Bryobacteraceae bacterium]